MKNASHQVFLKRYLLWIEPVLFSLWLASLLPMGDWMRDVIGLVVIGVVVLFAVNFLFWRFNRGRESVSRKYFVRLSVHSFFVLSSLGFVVFFLSLDELPIRGMEQTHSLLLLASISLVAALVGTAAKWLVWVVASVWATEKYNRSLQLDPVPTN